MTQHLPKFPFAALAGAVLLLAGCGGPSEATETIETATSAAEAPTAATTATATTTPEAGPSAVEEDKRSGAHEASDAELVLGHIEQLALEIGVREAGSAGERAAAAYIEGVLAAAGYETTMEPFTASTRTDRSTLVTAGGVSVRPFMMNGSATGEATGRLLYGGLGAPEELAALELVGAVLLVDRGVLPFSEKVSNAEAAGAVAVVIANNGDGAYSGTLGGLRARIPVVAIRQAEGELLRPLAGRAVELTVRAAIEQIEVTSQNVVGRAGIRCEVYLGAHYDSVPAGPGANDNASGTALLLEVARVHRADGVCVVAFGAEEIGLFGSRAFVDEHDVSGARLMLNFDMAGRLDGPIIVGDAVLTREILAALVAAGEFPIEAGEFPPFASSDHVSFSDAGVSAVTITSGDDAAIHTSEDDLARISLEALATMLEIVDVALEELAVGELTAAG